MQWKIILIRLLLVLFLVATLIVEMCVHNRLFNAFASRKVVEHVQSESPANLSSFAMGSLDEDAYLSGVYYSNWSPYPPRLHFPHDIDLSRISHVYYAFFLVDGATGRLKNGDDWSDSGMDLYKPLVVKLKRVSKEPIISAGDQKQILPNGCLGELFYLRHTKLWPDSLTRDFKVIMCVGGWSNREEFPKMVRDPARVTVFVDSCVDTMFKYGFDGIDLDWEFPEDDGYEPQMYLELAKRLRAKMDELEARIFGSTQNHPKFQLSVATPAFSEKLRILPIKEMDEFVDIWNMMTYDYYGEWSEKTGYHSNLYDGSGKSQPDSQKRHVYASDDAEGLDGNSAVTYMIEDIGVMSRKVCLGMAAYGRGFKHVSVKPNNERYIDMSFSGVGGASEGEPGMWLYNQLPIGGSQEVYDPEYVSAFCYDAKSKTFVGYDNVDSVRTKAQYVKEKKLAGGFFWESCGDDHRNPSHSLLNSFTNEVRSVRKFDNLIYRQPQTLRHYIEKFGDAEYLSPFLRKILQDEGLTT